MPDIRMPDIRGFAMQSKSWPFEEARKLLKRYQSAPPKKGYILFETGYGPSGLPHIGTFGEVLRTSMVRYAFSQLSDIPTRLICFSDDMDGLRKVPGNVPNQALLAQHLNKPLTQVPDPFEKFESFAHHNNAKLQAFLDAFGFDYEFASSTQYYTSGRFDVGLRAMLAHYDAVMQIMLPSFRAQRAQSYSPFLPIDEESGKVLQVPIIAWDRDKGSITYEREDGAQIETLVTGGKCKLQWKPDWSMRWHVLGVDYEMAGKDLIDSVKLSSKICRQLGSQPPEGFNYELFLDQNGEKISKSKGNGLSIEAWLRYAPDYSLSYFMFGKPKTGKRLYFDIIPKNVDEYQQQLQAFAKQTPEARLDNPIWHIHQGKMPEENLSPLSFALLLNLVAASNSKDKDLLWGFISRYLPDATPETYPALDKLVGFAIQYYHDFIFPHKQYRKAEGKDYDALCDLRHRLAELLDEKAQDDVDRVQNLVYNVGKDHGYNNLRDWFQAQYSILLGQESGPRIASFYVLYGIERTLALMDEALKPSEKEEK